MAKVQVSAWTNPVVKDEQTPFVNHKADGLPEAKATVGSVDFSFSLTPRSRDLPKKLKN